VLLSGVSSSSHEGARRIRGIRARVRVRVFSSRYLERKVFLFPGRGLGAGGRNCLMVVLFIDVIVLLFDF
jgi:hypothetical protein